MSNFTSWTRYFLLNHNASTLIELKSPHLRGAAQRKEPPERELRLKLDLASWPVGKGFADAMQNVAPIAAPGLAEQGHRRVPGARGPFQPPSPVGRPPQQEPDRPGGRAGEMDDSGVDADDEVERVHDGGGIEKAIGPAVEAATQRLDLRRSVRGRLQGRSGRAFPASPPND